MARKQLMLGAPSLLGKAADEALGLFGPAYPLTLELTNQTPSAHQFHTPDFRVEVGETVSISFASESILGKFANNAQQVAHLAGFDDAFVLSEPEASDAAEGGDAADSEDSGKKKGGRGKKAASADGGNAGEQSAADTAGATDSATESATTGEESTAENEQSDAPAEGGAGEAAETGSN